LGHPEKGGFALVHLITTFDNLLLGNANLRIMTDHRNLVYNYNPLSVDQSLARHTVHKFQHWALKLSVFNYIIEQSPGQVMCGQTSCHAGAQAINVTKSQQLTFRALYFKLHIN
jgi:RNase H-like domain found in reverse transcriptase